MSAFAGRLIEWQRSHGRSDLPWQHGREPYRVWLSEIMLQQTQVATVVGYYQRFLARFPDVHALAAADLDEVLALWAGLGYYARARHLHACARAVVSQHGGQFPQDAQSLAQLPGIGRSTAAAIAAFCFDERTPILDGNVKRVLARHHGIDGFPGQARVEQQLWAAAAELLPAAADMPAYTQALMDLGATLCTRTRPRCGLCPIAATCVARRDGRVHELPTPRPRRIGRVRRAYWLLALLNGTVLLEQRSAVGLWGGLWAPPEFDRREQLRSSAHLLGGSTLHWLPTRRHAFTHYTLEYTPALLHLGGPPPRAESPGRRWVALTQPGAALPAPVQRLLEELAQASGSTPSATRKRETML